MKTTYNSYEHANVLEDFAKFLEKNNVKPYPELKKEIKSLRKAKQTIIKG